MHERRLGDSQIDVSAIALGSWLTYAGGVAREQTEACTRAAFEAGITLFDTANVYGRGAAERAWGEILSDYPRDSFILATKLYFPMAPRLSPLRARERGLSGKQIHKQLDASLRRLRTDFVDLYQCHRYDDGTPLEETMQALTEVVQAGKARCIGFSEWPIQHIRRAVEMPGVARFVSSQPEYSALRRQAEREVMPVCARHGISQIVWSPLAQGLLTGKYRSGQAPPPDSRAAHSEMGTSMGLVMNDATLEAVDRLRPIAAEAGLSMAELALAWVLRRSELASAIVGASRPEQVHANAKASGIELSPDTLTAIDEALGDTPVKETTLAPAARSGVTRR
jgi:1-deoxyxylulose-5-phosphate synthase